MAHAPRLIAELIGEAFIAAIERSRQHPSGRARSAWRWFLEATEAPPGIELIAPDGATYTGFVVVERSRAVLVFALRHPLRRSERPLGAEWDALDRSVGVLEDDDVAWDEQSPFNGR